MPKLRIPKLSALIARLSQLPRPVAIGLTAFGSTLLAVLFVFGADRLTNGGEVLGSVVGNGVEIGGLGERDAVARLREMEITLRATPIPVSVAGHTFSLDPQAISFDLDETAMVAAAMRNGRSGNVLGQLGWWVGHFGGDAATVVPIYTYDTARLDEIVREWEIEGIDQPAYPGDIRIENGAIVYEYPAAGLGIEQSTALELLDRAFTDPTRTPVVLPTRLIEPPLSAADIDTSVLAARQLVEGDVTLTDPDLGFEVILPRHLLTQAVRITRDESGDIPEFIFDLDDATILAYVGALGPYLETDAVDAEIVIDDVAETVSIVPSVPFREPDRSLLMDEVWAALATPERRGELAYAYGREADFSTADAEALGITGVIGEFTTNHACCAARVTNIHLIADAVDGALVMPGEEFSLNEWVGQRTAEKGYLCAGALLGNELVHEGAICIGGGSSQFTTTLYNAAFFAGLEDVAHTPHSVYFSRYPEGREATLGWRYPELIFGNNTPNAFIIKTSYTDTSITAKIYGDNGGLVVEAGLSNRYGHTGIVTVTRQNDDLAAPYCSEGTAKQVQAGSPGWSVTVYRYITYPDGTQTTESWGHRYQGAWKILEWDADDETCLVPPTP